jgi:integrase
MRNHYLGPPKTKKSRRTISLSPALVAILERNLRGKRPDDFIFLSPEGRALHQVDFYEDRWLPALKAAEDAGLTQRPRFHDLRHTHAAWLISAGVPLPKIQERLGHESITTTIDVYGGLTDQTDRPRGRADDDRGAHR